MVLKGNGVLNQNAKSLKGTKTTNMGTPIMNQ